MRQYYRDKSSKTLTITDPEKEKEILFRRKVDREITALKNEINTLKEKLDELLAKRN
jgi:chorismate mutase